MSEQSDEIPPRFLHSLRSVAIDEVAEAHAKVIDEVAEAHAKEITATSIEMGRILTDRQSFGRFGA